MENLSKVEKGEAARQMICARLLFGGVKVFKPVIEDTPIDLLVLRGDGSVVKCQCKLLFQKPEGNHIMCLCSIRKGNKQNGQKAFRRRYTPEEVDVFIGYCYENDSVYVIPYSEAQNRAELSFWVTRQPQKGGSKTDQYKNTFSYLK